MTFLSFTLWGVPCSVSRSASYIDRVWGRIPVSPISSVVGMLHPLLCGHIRWHTFHGYGQRFCRRTHRLPSGAEVGVENFIQVQEHLWLAPCPGISTSPGGTFLLQADHTAEPSWTAKLKLWMQPGSQEPRSENQGLAACSGGRGGCRLGSRISANCWPSGWGRSRDRSQAAH